MGKAVLFCAGYFCQTSFGAVRAEGTGYCFANKCSVVANSLYVPGCLANTGFYVSYNGFQESQVFIDVLTLLHNDSLESVGKKTNKEKAAVVMIFKLLQHPHPPQIPKKVSIF